MSNRRKYSKKDALQTRSGTSVPTALPRSVLAGVALIVVAVLVAYFPSINGGFVLDDDLLLTNSKLIMTSDGLYRLWCTTESLDYWPVTNTSFWIEWRLWGMKSTGYHVTNLTLHIVEALLVWIILRKLSIPGAFLAAMIFAVHPVNVESVAWIAQRKNMMAMLFFLLSIICYLKFLTRARLRLAAKQSSSLSLIPHPSSLIWYCLSLAAFVLAMLSKGSVVVLPVLLLGIVWWLRPLTRLDLLRTAPFFLVALILAAVNMWFQTHGTETVYRTASFTERLLGAGGVVWFYLYKALLPVDLAFVYPRWHIEVGNPLWWLPLLAALIVTAVLWGYRKGWSRPFLFAWGFFCVSLMPVMGFADVGFMKHSLVADHYQHIAMIGVIALVATGWSIWQKRAHEQAYSAAKPLAVVVVGALIFLTWRQSGLYRDPLTLYQATLEKNPDCWMAHNNLGAGLLQAGHHQEAYRHFQEALRLNPDYPEAYNNLGGVLAQTGRPQEAIKYFQEALRYRPDYLEAHNNLGDVFLKTGRLEEAIAHCEQALAIKPDYPEALNNLGNALLEAGRLPEAIKYYQQALSIKPNFSEPLNNLGNVLFKVGRLQEAIGYYEQALRLKPNLPELHDHLGLALVQTGRSEEAIKHFQQALALKPDSVDVNNNLGATLAQTGRFEEAIEHFKRAVKLKPDYFNAYKNLAMSYASLKQSSEAVAAAQKAKEIAQSQGQTALAKEMEDWLNSYRAGLRDIPNTPPSSDTVPLQP